MMAWNLQIIFETFERSRDMSFKEYNQDQPFLLPLSLHDFLPEGRLACIINAAVKKRTLESKGDRK